MSDDTDQFTNGDTQPGNEPSDPLGIIGWVIGGKYKVRAHLGGGGFGEVYDGYNVNLIEQRLVLKFFKRVQARDKFSKEAKILCRLDHPNICRVIDFLDEEGALVVAYIDGKDTAEILKESGTLNDALFLNVAKSMTDALAYAHERKIAHRDIKPGNIMVDSNNRAYLIDFGIAKEIGGAATRTGYQALTPMFAAPERQQGDMDYNPFLSDVYEMGVTLFTFCTNTMPYRNPTNPDISEWGGVAAEKLTPELVQILKKATHPDPGKRYKGVRQLADDVAKLEQVYVVEKKRKVPIILTIAFIAIVAAAVLQWQGYFGTWLERTWAKVVTTEQQAEHPPATTPAVDSSALIAQVAPDSLPVEPQDTVVKATTTPATIIPPVAEKPVEEPEPEKPPPPPTPPQMYIRTIPAGVISLFFDGREIMPNTYIETTKGRHTAEVLDPDYPILSRIVTVNRDTTHITMDLLETFTRTDSIDLRLALNPPTDEHVLELSFNTRKRRFNSFPVFDLVRLGGEWQLEASIFALNSDANTTIAIDSMVTFPFGGGKHIVLNGNSGRMTFETVEGEGTTVIPLLLYWSEQ